MRFRPLIPAKGRPVLIAGAIAIVATVWILSGQFGGDDSAEAPAPLLAAAPDREAIRPTVRVHRQSAAPHSTDLVVRGRTEALRTVVVRAETDARVEAVTIEEGAQVFAGTTLVTLAIDDRAARRAQAEAALRQRQIEYDAASKLSRKGLQSQNRLAAAKADLELARADLEMAKLQMDRTRLKAPFDGVMDDRAVEVGDYVQVGDPVATMVDLDPVLIVGEVSERDVGKVKVGTPAQARLIDGASVSGTIRFVSARGNTETRTFRVELQVPNPGYRIRENVTAEIILAGRTVMAHRISPMVLTLTDSGVVGVKTVDEQDRVAFHPVQVVSELTEGLFVSGLPLTARIITVGQEFVSEGEAVTPVDAPSLSPAMPRSEPTSTRPEEATTGAGATDDRS